METRRTAVLAAFRRLGSKAAVAKELGISRQRVWQILNPEKLRAHQRVRSAVRTGRLVKPVRCSRCGGERGIEARYRDYARRLNIEWLCSGCRASVARESIPNRQPARFHYDAQQDLIQIEFAGGSPVRLLNLAKGIVAHLDANSHLVRMEILGAVRGRVGGNDTDNSRSGRGSDVHRFLTLAAPASLPMPMKQA